MGSSEPELQGGTRGEEVKQRTQQINKGEQRGKTRPDTKQSTPSEIERHWPAENKPWHCTIDAIGGITQPRLHNATTPLCRGCIRTVTRGPDDATTPVYRRQSRRRQADKPMTLYHRRNRRHHATKNAQRHDTTCVGGAFERSREAETTPRHLCATCVDTGHIT